MGLLLKETLEIRVDTEEEAKEKIEEYRQKAKQSYFSIDSAGYTYKKKKKGGEVIAEAYVVKIVMVHDELWGDLE